MNFQVLFEKVKFSQATFSGYNTIKVELGKKMKLKKYT